MVEAQEIISISSSLFGSFQNVWCNIKNDEERRRVLILMLKTEMKFNLDIIDCLSVAKELKYTNSDYSIFLCELQNELAASILFYEFNDEQRITKKAVKTLLNTKEDNKKILEELTSDPILLIRIYQKINLLKVLAKIELEKPNVISKISFDRRLKNLKRNILELLKTIEEEKLETII